MAFDSILDGPGKPQVQASHRPNIEVMNQPGAYVDSEPGSEISMDVDQISIQLSDGEDSKRAESEEVAQIEQARNDTDPAEAQDSLREDDQFNDCDLSEVNYRSSVSHNRHIVPGTSLPQGASSKITSGIDENMAASPDPKRYRSHQQDSQESGMKLLNPNKEAGQSPNKLINRLDPLR